jgi:organic radical activating enzyme
MIRIQHLETDVTTACQLSCVACNHHVPLHRAKGPQHASVEQVERDLTHLASILHTHLWAAIGGEPLLNPKLVSILVAARRSGVMDRIEVWTNGLMLPWMKDDFWAAFDVLVLSVYPGTLREKAIEAVQQRCGDSGVELALIRRPGFRALLEETPSGRERTLDKYQRCFFRSYSRVANQGYFYTCCCAPHMPVLLTNKPPGTDGVAIEGLTEESLRLYLEQAEPLSVCSVCAGGDDRAANVPWREERDPVRWIVASKGER